MLLNDDFFWPCVSEDWGAGEEVEGTVNPTSLRGGAAEADEGGTDGEKGC